MRIGLVAAGSIAAEARRAVVGAGLRDRRIRPVEGMLDE